MPPAFGALLYGLRLSAAVCLALWLAFRFELREAYWAGTTAALVCQSVLGSTLRKGLFRVIGTVVGAVAVVGMVACFPQDRVGFSLCLSGWCGFCCFAGSRLTNFAAYAAALAGYSAAIIAGDVLAAPDQTFAVALARVSEILIGVACGTTVMSLTDFGTSRRRLSEAIRNLAETASTGLRDALLPGEPPAGHGHSPAAELRRLGALAPGIDQARGENAFNTKPVRAALDGLFSCIAAADLMRNARREAPLPTETTTFLLQAFAGVPQRPAAACLGQVASKLRETPADGRSRRLLDRAADGLDGALVAIEVADWLDATDGRSPPHATGVSSSAPADPLPAILNALRGAGTVGLCEVLWMASRWPAGPVAIEFAAITVILLSLRQDGSIAAADGFGLGVLLAIVLAAVAKFALLPDMVTFAGLSAVLFAMLAPLAALSTFPRFAAALGPATMNFVPILGPANIQSYDTAAFYNSATAILVGCVIGALSLRLVPSLPTQTGVRRILAAAQADRAAIGLGTWQLSASAWTNRMRSRAASLPPAADDASFSGLAATFEEGLALMGIPPGRVRS